VGAIRGAGVIAILGSSFSLFVALACLFFLAGPYVFYSPSLGAMIALCAGGGVLGLFTGVGLCGMKSWARISALTFSGLIVGLSASILLYQLARPATPYRTPLFVVFWELDSLPLAVAIWWLILFTRKDIVAQFADS